MLPDDTDPMAYTKLLNKTKAIPDDFNHGHMAMSKIHVHHGSAFSKKKNHPLIVVFRGLFDDFLKMRYHFYAELMNGDFKKPGDNQNVGTNS